MAFVCLVGLSYIGFIKLPSEVNCLLAPYTRQGYILRVCVL